MRMRKCHKYELLRMGGTKNISTTKDSSVKSIKLVQKQGLVYMINMVLNILQNLVGLEDHRKI